MGERPTILLADDEEAITAELKPFLERAGFAVIVARGPLGRRACQSQCAAARRRSIARNCSVVCGNSWPVPQSTMTP